MIAYYIYDTSCLFFTYCLYTNEKNKLCRSYRFDGKLTQKFFMSTDEIESAVYALKDSRVHCNDIRRNEPDAIKIKKLNRKIIFKQDFI